MKTEICEQLYKDPIGHDSMNCDACRLEMGHEKCNGCDSWERPEKLHPVDGMDDYKFCSDCLEENPHFCANEKSTGNDFCDRVVFGNQKYCNCCIGKSITADVFETLEQILKPKK